MRVMFFSQVFVVFYVVGLMIDEEDEVDGHMKMKKKVVEDEHECLKLKKMKNNQNFSRCIRFHRIRIRFQA